MDNPEHEPWDAPPDWVHLPDVPGWIERRLGFPGLPLVPSLISALRQPLVLTYRIGDTKRASEFYDLRNGYRLPPGMSVYDYSKRVVVNDWEKADPDWRTGTVAGWKLNNGSRDRLPIEVNWLSLERWAPPLARDLASRARKAATSIAVGADVTADASGKGPEPAGAGNLDPQRGRGGHPTLHDWDRFWIQVALWTAKNDVDEPEKLRPELRRHMLKWVQGLDKVPEASTVEKKLALLWAEANREARLTPRN